MNNTAKTRTDQLHIDRVIVGMDGESVSPRRAASKGIVDVDRILVRDDGWTLAALGACNGELAESLWRGNWVSDRMLDPPKRLENFRPEAGTRFDLFEGERKVATIVAPDARDAARWYFRVTSLIDLDRVGVARSGHTLDGKPAAEREYMRWKRTSSEPITTERFVAVRSGDREAFASVRWACGVPCLCGTVYEENGYDEATGESLIDVVDDCPILDSQRSGWHPVVEWIDTEPAPVA